MKNIELFNLNQALDAVAEVPQSSKFNYAFNKNRHRLKAYLRSLDKNKPHPQFGEFEKKRIEVCEEFCDRDDDGEIILDENKYTGLKGNEGFDKAIEDLKVEYADMIAYNKEVREKANESLYDEADFEIHMVGMEDVGDGLSPAQMDAIGPMILGYKEEMEGNDA